MAIQWTTEQQQVIKSRNENILVAASAGSGKTAVLVQHILDQILDPIEPLSVSELLVVTFTRAAAGEMKERLRQKLEEAWQSRPWDTSLKRQIYLLDQAHICTIDSFCQWLVKNYFHLMDLDPDFRILEEGEGKLLRGEVMEKVLDEYYQENREEFLHFMDSFASGKGDVRVRELVEKVYFYSESSPWPEEWLNQLGKQVLKETGSFPQDNSDEKISVSSFVWADRMEEELRNQVSQWKELAVWGAEVCREELGLDKYETMFLSDAGQLQLCLDASDLDGFLDALGNVTFVRKPVISKKAQADENRKNLMSELRDQVKEGVTLLSKRYVFGSVEEMASYILHTEEDCRMLAEITLCFRKSYQQIKMEKNLADFSDIEHWALDLLLHRENGKTIPTPLADELGKHFREIIIDEYQDSNQVQEWILTSLSGERRGEPNLFMVGDVKQSIYKFRMAKPELFQEKYHCYSYQSHEKSGRKIDLSKNFRSRREILRQINHIFHELMGESLGGVNYDDKAELRYGASYPQPDPSMELLLADSQGWDVEDPELEGRLMAKKIRELMNPESPFLVWDIGKEEYRPVQYRDMVILLRTMDGWADTITGILNQEGIPAHAERKKGYFQAVEVQILLNFLKILDNPRQDIPLVSVLHSPLFGYTEEELALIAAGTEKKDFYLRCRDASAQGILREKWEYFESVLKRYRKMAVYTSIAEIFENILEETEYRLILAAMPDGAVRLANVEMLMEKARSYEETIYHGIFHFLRYIEKLQTYEVDFGEASVLSENENLIRVTSIHKSKGLEYPVVFAAGLGKSFNFQDSRQPILVHEELGMACDYTDPKERIRIPTIWKHFVADYQEKETRGEELRILYVALTRAKEKLICVGTTSSLSRMEEKIQIGNLWREICEDSDIHGTMESTNQHLSPVILNRASSYLDWIWLAQGSSHEELPEFQIFSAEELLDSEILRQAADREKKAKWLREGFLSELDENVKAFWAKKKSFRYPWQEAIHQKTVLTVSERKQQEEMAVRPEIWNRNSISDMEENGISDMEGIESIKDNSAGMAKPGGASLGTAYHRVLERIPVEEGQNPRQIAGCLDQMTEEGILDPEMRKMISIPSLCKFYQSELGEKMRRAAARGQLYREQPFVMSIPYSEIYPEQKDSAMADEPILVQGIIDAFLEEDGELILWDYKTDRVFGKEGERYLADKYRPQLRDYAKALEQSRNQKVKEKWIYSFSLNRAIRLD
ncbi:MAG: helicase-exonuclease AddAB subunit AddA [Clostridiales bacterium]|nr:helicase-exonuclease AddAB subunit AddA [Clostridiales bacterium]